MMLVNFRFFVVVIVVCFFFFLIELASSWLYFGVLNFI